MHEFDSCCFRAAGLFDGIKRYNSWAQDLAGGWFQTAVTAGNFHQFNLRDKVIVSVMIERLREDQGTAFPSADRLFHHCDTPPARFLPGRSPFPGAARKAANRTAGFLFFFHGSHVISGRKGRLDKADFSLLPFDDLRVQ